MVSVNRSLTGPWVKMFQFIGWRNQSWDQLAWVHSACQQQGETKSQLSRCTWLTLAECSLWTRHRAKNLTSHPPARLWGWYSVYVRFREARQLVEGAWLVSAEAGQLRILWGLPEQKPFPASSPHFSLGLLGLSRVTQSRLKQLLLITRDGKNIETKERQLKITRKQEKLRKKSNNSSGIKQSPTSSSRNKHNNLMPIFELFCSN